MHLYLKEIFQPNFIYMKIILQFLFRKIIYTVKICEFHFIYKRKNFTIFIKNLF